MDEWVGDGWVSRCINRWMDGCGVPEKNGIK